MSDGLIIFDVDGTLIDSQAHILAAMQAAFDGLGLPAPTRAETLGIVGLSLPVAMQALAPHLDAQAQAALVEGYKRAYSAGDVGALSPLYPGVTEGLAALGARYTLAIATGKSRRGLDHVMAAHGWNGVFASLQVADDHPSKPHPSMIAACLRETGIARGRAVMVGDTRFDMDMAQAAGVAGLGVDWGYHTLSGVPIVSQFEQIAGAVQDLMG